MPVTIVPSLGWPLVWHIYEYASWHVTFPHHSTRFGWLLWLLSDRRLRLKIERPDDCPLLKNSKDIISRDNLKQ